MDDNHTFVSEFFRTGNCKEGGSCAGLVRKVCRKGCADFSMIPLCDEAYMKGRASARETPENWVRIPFFLEKDSFISLWCIRSYIYYTFLFLG
jgi:hypothetical protein